MQSAAAAGGRPRRASSSPRLHCTPYGWGAAKGTRLNSSMPLRSSDSPFHSFSASGTSYSAIFSAGTAAQQAEQEAAREGAR